MNLETIQSRMQDIEQLRSASQENERMLLYEKGRSRTACSDTEGRASSLSLRLLLAAAFLACLIYADYREIPEAGELLHKASEAISYNIDLEAMENPPEIWYTILTMLQNGRHYTAG